MPVLCVIFGSDKVCGGIGLGKDGLASANSACRPRRGTALTCLLFIFGVGKGGWLAPTGLVSDKPLREAYASLAFCLRGARP